MLTYFHKWKLVCPDTLMFLDGLDFCLIENNSLSVDKELFLFKIRKKKGYSESERMETISDKTKWHFRLNQDVVLNIKLKCVKPVLDGFSNKVKVIKY